MIIYNLLQMVLSDIVYKLLEKIFVLLYCINKIKIIINFIKDAFQYLLVFVQIFIAIHKLCLKEIFIGKDEREAGKILLQNLY